MRRFNDALIPEGPGVNQQADVGVKGTARAGGQANLEYTPGHYRKAAKAGR